MKKILIFLAVLLISIAPSFAKDNHKIKFNGEKYTLLYSTKNPELGGYINEYYKRGETYNIWTEMVGVHHFPNAYSPIDQIVDFRKYLSSINCPSCISFDEDKNTGIIDFIMISENHAPVIMEFNIFKYTKSDKCGSVAIQYAKRYAVKNAFEAEEVKKEFTKTRKNTLKKIAKMNIPDVVFEEIDKCAVKKDILDSEKEQIKTEVTEKETKENTEEIQEAVKKEETEETVQSNKEPENTETADTYKKETQKITEEQTVTEEQKTEDKTENSAEEQKTKTKTKNLKKEDTAEEQHAPVPVEEKVKTNNTEVKNHKKGNKTEINDKTKNKKQKAKKTKNDKKEYRLENTKDQYYAQPRDYKEIVAECKRLQKEQKKLKKANAKKLKKERAKKASKKLSE